MALWQVVETPEEEHNPLKNWREKMAGQPLPEDPAKKSKDLKAEIQQLSLARGNNFAMQLCHYPSFCIYYKNPIYPDLIGFI